MLAAMPERTRYRPTADSALTIWIVRHAAWLIPRFRVDDVQSPFYRAMGGQYRGKLVEFGENSFCTSSRCWKGIWKSRADVGRHMEIWCVAEKERPHRRTFVRTDDGVVNARSVRRLTENSWSGENLKSVIVTPQKPRSTTTDGVADPRAVPEVHEHVNQDEEANDNGGEDEESPDKPEDEDHDMEGETLPQPDTTATSSSSRGEKRTETHKNVFVKRRLVTKSPKQPITLVKIQ